MHHTASTALTRVSSSVTRHWRLDAWLALSTVYVGEDAVEHTSMVFDASYWSAAAVEAVLATHTATLEAAYEL
jgi:hypothetical protein